jgi:hypothetical protein
MPFETNAKITSMAKILRLYNCIIPKSNKISASILVPPPITCVTQTRLDAHPISISLPCHPHNLSTHPAHHSPTERNENFANSIPTPSVPSPAFRIPVSRFSAICNRKSSACCGWSGRLMPMSRSGCRTAFCCMSREMMRDARHDVG